MTAVANSVITVLLSWVRGIASAIWDFFSGSGGSALAWLGEHWKILAIILIAVCAVIDLTVYFLRWRPSRVWATFFRHLRGNGQHAVDNGHQHYQDPVADGSRVRRWVYADGSVREEIVQEEAPQEDPVPQEPVSIPQPADSSAAPVRRRRSQQAAGIAPMPVEQMTAAEEAPASPQRRRRSQSGNVSRLHRLLSDDTGESNFRYTPEQTAGSREEKYNEPFYPPQYRYTSSEDHAND